MVRMKPVWYKILEYPLLQYIPLSKSSLVVKENISSSFQKPQIKALNDSQDLHAVLKVHNLDRELVNQIIWEKELPIAALNLSIKELKYRTTKVVVLAQEVPKFMEIFTVNRSYFYRNNIYFVVYNNKGERLSTPTGVFLID
ncbi:MAG: hypothetical protein GX318_04430 [Clostridia bacterium]|nr:hypothetical protein [Clostridia bacterium]